MDEIVPKNSPWNRKYYNGNDNNPWTSPPNSLWNWKPIRLTGKFQFRKRNSVQNLRLHLTRSEPTFANLVLDDDYPTCNNQFRQYCDFTSLHGFRYIMEDKRNISERIFWICWCLFGISAAMYMMSKIWQRWADSPVITSVATTNYPVTNVIFPAVTICTVNKAVNEKLIIQGCRYNKTLSQMKNIISTLVDPEGRNNDNDNFQMSAFGLDRNYVGAETALKLLRLVAPKCQDYLLTCRWNSQAAPCNSLFKLVLTDTGYCCSFNAVESRIQKKTVKSDAEVLKQEGEYDFLQKAVWDYTDRFRDKNGPPSDDDTSTNFTIPDSYTCARKYEDDLFPGICRYISKCRENPKGCKISANPPPSSPSMPRVSDDFPFKAVGAGRSRGLTLMLDTLRCDTVPTDSFRGLSVYVHNPEEFPSVGEKGFLVGPGMETQVSVTGTDTYSTEALRAFNAIRRGCYFSDEFPLKYYKEYSRSSCVVECENQFIFDECQCVPYYSPGNYTICSLTKMKDCVRKAIDSIQKNARYQGPIPLSSSAERKIFRFKTKEEMEQDKSCTEFCLPACNETFYDSAVTAATFPNQPQPNMTKMLREAIAEKYTFLNDIGYVSASISVLRIFFRESSIMQYKRDELFTWEDFVSNLGGVMGLCLGFSLLSLIEVIYFFTMRLLFDRTRHRRAHATAQRMITGKY